MENVNKKYNVIVFNRATQMLISHPRFLSQLSDEAAKNLINEFQEKAKSLVFMPERNPLLEDVYLPPGKYHKLLMGKRYLLVYQFKNDVVYIDYVIDCRQNYYWLL